MIKVMPDFSQRVYRVVRKIPKGKVIGYKEVAKRAGNPKAFRAVGNILHKHNLKNLPCHRVVGSNYDIGGYRYGIKKKIALLKSEGIKIIGHKIIH